jgi:hypothetical protein
MFAVEPLRKSVYDVPVLIDLLLFAQQRIATLEKERDQLRALFDWANGPDPDVDNYATMTPEEMDALHREFAEFKARRQRRDDAEARITELEAQVADLSAQLAAQQWQPIETAPLDGTQILVRCCGEGRIGFWDGYHWLTVPGRYAMTQIPPTHWMPFPDPPLAAQQEPNA